MPGLPVRAEAIDTQLALCQDGAPPAIDVDDDGAACGEESAEAAAARVTSGPSVRELMKAEATAYDSACIA